ncbi:MAG TPA: hypothetical protein VLM17_03775 [Xanthomonadaceae bacterium]|nr:hypothetical protein [Xanthomonadaceae bacterium]
MTRAFTRQSHPDMGQPLPTPNALPQGQPAGSLGTDALAALRDRLTAVERRLQAIAPDAPNARAERDMLRREIHDLQQRLAGDPGAGR